MNALSDDQKEEIEKLIESHGVTRRLSSGQKWDVVILLSGFLAGAVALLGAGGFFIVDNASREAAADVAAKDVANELADKEEFLAAITSAKVPLPSGVVMAFDVSDGCPKDGWSEFASGRGRVIVGATPPGAEAGSLTKRSWQEQGGEEKVTLDASTLPPHSHSTVGPFAGYGVSTGVANVGIVPTIGNDSQTGATGEGQPHNNMPPYIALYFCKKD